MTDRELFRRGLLVLWAGALVYYGLAWFASVGWIGPGWALQTWSVVAAPLSLATLVLARRVPGWSVREIILWGLSWGILLGLTFVPADTVPWMPIDTPARFWTLVAVYTIVPLGIIWRAAGLLIRARQQSLQRVTTEPWRAIASLAALGALAAVCIVYLMVRPTHTFLVRVERQPQVDAVQLVWDSVLTIPTKRGNDTPEGVQSLGLTTDSAGNPAIFGRFRPGTSRATREAVLDRLRRYPRVVAVDTASHTTLPFWR